MPKFRKKSVVIEAVQLLWSTWSEMCDFVEMGELSKCKPEGCYIDSNGLPTKDPCLDEIGLQIPTLEGLMLAREGDWVIKGVNGEFYPYKPDIFEKTYEPMED